MLRRIPKALRLTNLHVASFSKTFKVQNPYTLDVYCESEYKTEPEMQKIVKESYECHKKWKNVPLNERIAVVKKAAEYFSKNEEAIAIDITGQMGKPIYQSREELQGFQNIVQRLVELAPEGLADKIVKENQQGLLKYTREPIGVSAVFSPWNFPVRTCASVLLTSVLAGNSVVIKHSPFTPLIAKHFEESFKYAGIDNLVRDLMIATEDSVKLYQMPEIGFVGFTGSSEVGRCVQDEITQNRFMDYTLELGGNNAAYVAEDADLDHSAKELIYGAMYNAGQSSNSISRIYVHNSLYQDFINMALKYVYSYQMGDPMKEETSLGPLCQSDKLEGIQRLVEEAAAQGARIVIGGMQAADSDGRGQFFEPTLIADAQNDMQFMMVETFGPLVGIGTTEDDEEVIKLINDNQFGLSAAIFSKDKERILRMAPRLNVGTVYGNKVMQVDPRLPWCGRKNSGLGTNLSLLGFHSVTKPKSYNLKFQV